VKDNSVSVSDLSNPVKARLVAQCDLKDSVARLINFEYDNDLQASYPVERVKGENKGISHSFKVSNDQFATGSKTLVNFKRYYYLAVSYAYNNYKTYSPDDPDALDGQKKVYLSSRKAAVGEIGVEEGIPHNPMPESDGTHFSLEYGDSPEITKHDGHGNGGFIQRLSENSIQAILENGKKDSTFAYRYYKAHFWDNIDFSDDRMLRTPIFHPKVKQYMEKLTAQGPDYVDSINASADYLISKAKKRL
jgi:hypothetical protein